MRGLGREGLFRVPDFARLWTSNLLGDVGAAFASLALSVTAVLVLHASTFEVAVITALGNGGQFPVVVANPGEMRDSDGALGVEQVTGAGEASLLRVDPSGFEWFGGCARGGSVAQLRVGVVRRLWRCEVHRYADQQSVSRRTTVSRSPTGSTLASR